MRPGISSARKNTRQLLVRLLKLAQELETIYQTYPRLQSVVGYEAWQQLTDVVYRQLLDINLEPEDRVIRGVVAENLTSLEDLAASTLVRDRAGLRDTLSRVLMFRIKNGLATAQR